jgi:D-alanyl-D-alanine carboxypeptidase
MVAYVVMGKLATGGIKLTDKVTISKEAPKIGGSQVISRRARSSPWRTS